MCMSGKKDVAPKMQPALDTGRIIAILAAAAVTAINLVVAIRLICCLKAHGCSCGTSACNDAEEEDQEQPMPMDARNGQGKEDSDDQ